MHFPIITEQEKNLPFYVTGIDTQVEQELIERPLGFPNHQWLYCSSGCGVLEFGGTTYTIEPGMGFYFNANIPHSYHAINEPWVTHWVLFNGTSIPVLFKMFGLDNIGVFRSETHETALSGDTMALFLALDKIVISDNLDKITDSTGYLYTLLLILKKCRINTTTNQVQNNLERLRPTILYMESHLKDDLALNQIASIAGVTSHYLCKLFKNSFGISPIHYLMRQRLQKAKELLVHHPSIKIRDVAQNVGYSDTSYFCTIFKKQEKVTPQGFRKLHGLR